MATFITVLVIIAIVGSAVAYIYKEKKRGIACVGCSFAGQCSKRAQGGCSGNISADSTDIHSFKD